MSQPKRKALWTTTHDSATTEHNTHEDFMEGITVVAAKKKGSLDYNVRFLYQASFMEGTTVVAQKRKGRWTTTPDSSTRQVRVAAKGGDAKLEKLPFDFDDPKRIKSAVV